jgi:sodium/hydrogen antiporter
VAFFGIRGLGSIYYLAYGVNRAGFSDDYTMWTLAAVTIFTSLVIHGLTARPAMAWLQRQREHSEHESTRAADEPI